MKKFGFIIAIMIGAIACQEQLPSTGNFGADITEDGAKDVAVFIGEMADKEAMAGKISGTIQKVCQTEGCWYTLALPEGGSVRVIAKEHDFVIPKNASGKTAIAEGEAKIITTSVERLKHLAEDAGKSPEEIEAITEPKQEIEFTAKGVIIKE